MALTTRDSVPRLGHVLTATVPGGTGSEESQPDVGVEPWVSTLCSGRWRWVALGARAPSPGLLGAVLVPTAVRP